MEVQFDGSLHFRLAFKEQDMAKEVRREYKSMPNIEGVALDIGAHIGAAALLMLERGASSVLAVEPDPETFNVLEMNANGKAIVCRNVAVAEKNGIATLYRKERSSASHMVRRHKGRFAEAEVEVKTVTLTELLQECKPTFLKCDAEYGEYNMPELKQLPAFVKALAIELHLR